MYAGLFLQFILVVGLIHSVFFNRINILTVSMYKLHPSSFLKIRSLANLSSSIIAGRKDYYFYNFFSILFCFALVVLL